MTSNSVYTPKSRSVYFLRSESSDLHYWPALLHLSLTLEAYRFTYEIGAELLQLHTSIFFSRFYSFGT